jgi:membrane protease YdiL (CAAX protease family)
MRKRFSFWSFLALLLALIGPLVVAIAGAGAAPSRFEPALGIAAIALTVIVAFAVSILVDDCRFRDLGFARVSWRSVPIGLALSAFFIGIFGPLANWGLASLGRGGFEEGLHRVANLPTWLVILAIFVVAPSEELLYRAYAIERLGVLIGSRWIGGVVSLSLFFLAHVPMWGWAAALTTIVSGGLLTVVYLVRADVVALVIAHVITDLFGLVIADG